MVEPTIKDVSERVSAENKNVIEANKNIADYIENLKQGNILPPEASDVDPSNTTPAEESTAPSSDDTFCAFVKGNSVRMRDNPNTTDSTVLTLFDQGHYLHILSLEGDWYYVEDTMTKNDATGMTQDHTDLKGYIMKDFIVKDYSQLN